MTMGIVDTIMAGHIDAGSIGAGGLGSMMFFPIVISGTGLLYGMDTLVSHAVGARDDEDCRRTLIAGLWLSILLAPFVAGALLLTIPLLRASGTVPDVMERLGPFVRALAWGVAPLMIYSALRRYLQARDVVRSITFAVISANLVNFCGNWMLMFGHWGAPNLGLRGSGISTSISRLYIAVVLGLALLRDEQRAGWPLFRMNWRPDFACIRKLFHLGLPAAVQIGVEGAVFGIVSVMAARLDELSLAAHTIALNVIAVTYMIPLGISSAAAVRVGQAMGRRDARGVAAAGWTALLLSGIFMGSAGVAFLTVPGLIAGRYTPDPSVIALSATLLWISAFFQLFDGFQIVATGALRGLGDTRTAAIVHFAGYWILGLPTAYLLCFRYGWGIRGIWVGLTVALVLIGLVLILAWRQKLHRTLV
jgi:MATE family multidrug resistance protein